MIRYTLRCEAGHGFDGWFRSSGDFDAQAARALLQCPACGSHAVDKALMAPAIASGKARAPSSEAEAVASPDRDAPPQPAAGEPVALVDEGQVKLRAMLRELKDHVTKTSEDVGDRFAEVARKMHAEEIEHRSIRGRATAEDAKALAEEGVAVHPLPVFPDDLN